MFNRLNVIVYTVDRLTAEHVQLVAEVKQAHIEYRRWTAAFYQ